LISVLFGCVAEEKIFDTSTVCFTWSMVEELALWTVRDPNPGNTGTFKDPVLVALDPWETSALAIFAIPKLVGDITVTRIRVRQSDVAKPLNNLL
jgi:hypothetical protein